MSLVLTVDVVAVLNDLASIGITDAEIARRCGIKAKSTVHSWRHGDKRPSLFFGLRLLMLHAKHFPDRSPLKPD